MEGSFGVIDLLALTSLQVVSFDLFLVESHLSRWTTIA